MAGAAAAAGLPLEEVRKEAEAAAASVGSMGLASRVCCLPGEQPARRWAAIRPSAFRGVKRFSEENTSQGRWG